LLSASAIATQANSLHFFLCGFSCKCMG